MGSKNLLFNGYRDDGPILLNDSSTKTDNFQSLLKFRAYGGDNMLKEHLKTASHNATYTSKETHKQMIMICGYIKRNQLFLKIQNACYFSVIDEATNLPITGNSQSVFST